MKLEHSDARQCSLGTELPCSSLSRYPRLKASLASHCSSSRRAHNWGSAAEGFRGCPRSSESGDFPRRGPIFPIQAALTSHQFNRMDGHTHTQPRLDKSSAQRPSQALLHIGDDSVFFFSKGSLNFEQGRKMQAKRICHSLLCSTVQSLVLRKYL